MPQSTKKRIKTYRPKHIQLPVMPELQKEFMFASHAAWTTLRLQPSAAAFDNLADIFNVIGQALQDTGRESVILASGMRALQDVFNRAERTGKIAIGHYEQPPITNAVLECESIVKQLDVVRLHHARIKTTHAARLARALNSTNQKEFA